MSASARADEAPDAARRPLVCVAPSPLDAALDAALSARGLGCEQAATAAEAIPLIQALEARREAPVVLLAPGEAWQRATARQLRKSAVRAPLVFLAAPAEEARVRRGLLFEPLIGRDVHVVVLADVAEVAAGVAAIAWAVQQRAGHRALLDRLNSQLRAMPLAPSDSWRLEAALREREERLKLVIEAAELGTWEQDLATRALQWDDRCKAIFGLPPDAEVDPATFLAAVHPDDRAGVGEAVRRALDPAGLGALQLELRITTPDGAERWVAALGRHHVEAEGGAGRFLGTLSDITARKQAEVERAALLLRAETARGEAETANRFKDEFLATLSHELRTPLTAMLGFTHLLRTGDLSSEEQERALETIERNGRAQAHIIDDLLDVSSILTGGLRFDVAEVDLRRLVERALDAARLAAEAKGVRLVVELGPSAAEVRGDAMRLQQIIWNLTTNALKFTPRGGSVAVRLTRRSAAIELAVSDTGKGITPEFLPHVFDRFRQEDGSKTRALGGLGLGLSIVRHLTELHGGIVQASSEGEGKGATFVVSLPLAPQSVEPKEASAARHAAVAEASARAPSRELEGLVVLVVEDDPDTRAMLSMLLARSGMRVTTTSSVAEALEALPGLRPDLLVSDIGMPEQDGVALIQQVRALPPEAGGATPAVALSGYTSPEDRERALGAGFDCYVPKPLKPAELRAALVSLSNRAVAPITPSG